MMTESAIQQSAVIWFNNNYCLKHQNPRCLIFSVPNEGSSAKEQMRKKQIGMLAGVSDTIVVLPSVVLFVEFKDATGRQRPNQLEFQQRIELLGFRYHIVRSLEEFQEIINGTLKK